MVTSNTQSLGHSLNLLSPYAVGFDRIFTQLNRHSVNNATYTGFPPYNIQKGGDYTYTIEMALAGFEKEEAEDEYTYHRGISYRKFDRQFTLADDIVVNSAKLENGMLTIELERIVPEEKKPRIIEVN